MAQQRARQQNAAEAQRHTAAEKAHEATKPAALQRDATDLAALARSKPLASRRIGSDAPIGLARPAARSLSRGR